MHPVDLALQIATKAHVGQLDRDGHPVVLHAVAVGMMGVTEEEKVAGFLHDVVEDSNVTFDELLDQGIPVGIVNALRLLTRDKQTPYFDYIHNIISSRNPIALQVKYNDLQHNYARGNAYPDLRTKYAKALELVKAAIEECSQISLYRNDSGLSTAIFAGGCFWGVQHQFEKLKGVKRTLVGYTGGDEQYPTYAEVRQQLTHHVEAVIVEYDEAEVSYIDLCKLFFEIHDPSQEDGVGPDIGSQYRSCVFYSDESQHRDVESVIAILRGKGHVVNTLVLPSRNFWIGEEYHQKYYEKTSGEPYCHIRVKKF